MFLLLSKTLDWLVSPLSWALLLLLLALASRRRPRRATGLVAGALCVLCAFSSEGVSEALMGWAEAGAERTLRPEVTYDAVIVLGGALDPDATARWGEPEFNAAGDRALRAFELLQSGWATHAILSAGTLDPTPGALAEAPVLARQLEAWGIDGRRLVEEPRSRNTRENAVETARLVRERGWTRLVLVTSAAHLPRALGCFHAVGLRPDAWPTDHRSSGRTRSLAPRAGNLGVSADALRELFGRVVYRALGYTAP